MCTHALWRVCTWLCVSVRRGQRQCLSVCVSMWWGCIELMAQDMSPRYLTHKSVSRSPVAVQVLVPDVITVATLSGQKSTEAFLYYWSWCWACRGDWRQGPSCRSAVRQLGRGLGGCHIMETCRWSIYSRLLVRHCCAAFGTIFLHCI